MESKSVCDPSPHVQYCDVALLDPDTHDWGYVETEEHRATVKLFFAVPIRGEGAGGWRYQHRQYPQDPWGPSYSLPYGNIGFDAMCDIFGLHGDALDYISVYEVARRTPEEIATILRDNSRPVPTTLSAPVLEDHKEQKQNGTADVYEFPSGRRIC